MSLGNVFAATVLNLGGVHAQELESGNTNTFDARPYESLLIEIVVSSLAADSLMFTLDRQGADGGWYPIWLPTALTAPGTLAQILGPDGDVKVIPGKACRVTWALAGTVTAAVAAINITGLPA